MRSQVSWQEAVGFCAWLSEKTGRKFRLPTEAEWEWAARGGSDQPMWFGGLDADFGPYENLADIRTKLFVVEGVDPHVKDAVADWEAFIPRIDSVDDGNFMEAREPFRKEGRPRRFVARPAEVGPRRRA